MQRFVDRDANCLAVVLSLDLELSLGTSPKKAVRVTSRQVQQVLSIVSCTLLDLGKHAIDWITDNGTGGIHQKRDAKERASYFQPFLLVHHSPLLSA